MINKKVLSVLTIAGAFVIGMSFAPNMVSADHFDPCEFPGSVDEEESNGKWANIWHAICSNQNEVDLDPDPSNEDQTLSGTGEVVLSTTAAGDGGGTVTCEDITGTSDLCDDDDVDDADNDPTNEIQNLVVDDVTSSCVLESVLDANCSATCPMGTQVTGGGYELTSFTTGSFVPLEVRVMKNNIDIVTNSWDVEIETNTIIGTDPTIHVTVLCASLT